MHTRKYIATVYENLTYQSYTGSFFETCTSSKQPHLLETLLPFPFHIYFQTWFRSTSSCFVLWLVIYRADENSKPRSKYPGTKHIPPNALHIITENVLHTRTVVCNFILQFYYQSSLTGLTSTTPPPPPPDIISATAAAVAPGGLAAAVAAPV